jgi:hypothetical protein
MERYLSLLGCLGALALAGALAPGSMEPADSILAALAPEDSESDSLGNGVEEVQPPAFAPEPPPLDPGLRVVPRGLEHGLVAVMPPGEWLPRTGVGAFYPYPECAVVGMPFAGLKMCGEGPTAAAK